MKQQQTFDNAEKKIVLTAGHTTKDLEGCPGLI